MRITILLLLLLITSSTRSQDSGNLRSDVTVVCLLVNDHDEAIAWYTEMLGFVVKQDVSYGEGQRWVSIAPDEHASTELSLGLARSDEERAIVGRQGGDYPFFVLRTPDIVATYNAMKDRGVVFLAEPKPGPGGMGTTFKDLYGNVIYLRGN